MKLISLNIEGYLHKLEALNFLKNEDADVVCLMECPEGFVSEVQALGYQTTYKSVRLVNRDGTQTLEGNLLASKNKHQAESFFIYRHPGERVLEKYDEKTGRQNADVVLLHATVEVNGEVFNIATTHFTWTPKGEEPSLVQQEDTRRLIELTENFAPHIICGDFNIPRHHNCLYDELTNHYLDAIPVRYKSSLDKNLHRRGQDSTRAHLFTDFMVDYVFTQPPYQAENVRLEFGISDHAAVVADIKKQNT